MNTFIIFMIKAALYLASFYLVYAIMLSRDTSYKRNRAFILMSVILSLILPIFTFKTARPMDIQFFGKMLNEVFITETPDGSYTLTRGVSGAEIVRVIYTIYIIGVIILLLRLLADLLNLYILVARQKVNGSRIIRFHSFNTAGFSAIGYIFLNSKLSPEESREIIKHEQNHLRRNHFLDVIFIEAAKAFQWFNPSVYMFDRSLRAIHEYQADEECLNSGIALVNYQSLLLNQVFRSKAFNLTNSFSNPSMIRKRMVMMTKKRTSALASIKLLIAIPAAAIVFFAISAYREKPNTNLQNIDYTTTTQTSTPDLSVTGSSSGTGDETSAEELSPPSPPPPVTSDLTKATTDKPTVKQEVAKELHGTSDADDSEMVPYVQVEEMPVFPGGDAALMNYLVKNTTYPEDAKKNNIQGRVIVRFCITENGSVNRISIIKGVDPGLDAEAIRVVGTLPAFNPARQGGKAVPVWYMVPLTFTLK